jgi:hypothetical protein
LRSGIFLPGSESAKTAIHGRSDRDILVAHGFRTGQENTGAQPDMYSV